MARKKQDETLQNVVFRMTPTEIGRLDRLALKADLTRSQFLRNLIVVGLEEVEVLEKFGIIRTSLTIRDICSWMSNKVTQAVNGEMDTAEKSELNQ
jgi:hypothetical protein